MKNQYGIEPCPFCGTSVVSCEYDGHYIWVECGNSNCKASMMAVRMDNGDADEAKKMWNTRPIEDALRADAKTSQNHNAAVIDRIVEQLREAGYTGTLSEMVDQACNIKAGA